MILIYSNLLCEMAETTIIVHINGYWREEDLSNILTHSGIFFVYESIYNPDEHTVDLLNLIYIGEALNIRERIRTHDKYNAWKNLIKSGNELCFATGNVEDYFRERVKIAYIFGNNPVGNNGHINQFPFDTTTLISTGKTALLKPTLTIKKNLPRYFKETSSSIQQDLVPVRSVQIEKHVEK